MPEEVFPTAFFQSVAKAGMISSVPRNPGAGPSLPSARDLLHKHTAPAPAAALPSTVQQSTFLVFFHGGLWSGCVSLQMWLR